MTQTAIIRLHRRASSSETRGAAIALYIDGQPVTAQAGDSILAAAGAAGCYIPALCAHPELPGGCLPQGEAGCGLCLVGVEGMAGLQRACRVAAAPDLRVTTNSKAIQQARQSALAKVLEHHPHVCLTCPQRDGCSRVMCCFNNTVEERCCSIMSHCELRKIADYVIIPATTPAYDSQKNRLPVVKNEPCYDRDYNLCIDCRRCLVACNTVRGVGCLEVKNRNGRSWVGPIADTLMASDCKFCNACVEVCPTGALIDRTQTPVQKQAEVAPCTTACPAGIDVPRYVQLAGLGQFAQANAVVREKLPFPGILGRACYAPCETDCRRGHLDDPLSIRSLKRIAAEHDDGQWRELQRRLPPSGRRVAVVGAGLAGLTVAFYLAKQGHGVTVFDGRAAAGGMARYGIPAYRLPRAVIDAELAEVERLGVEFCFQTRIEDVHALLAQGFDAVFIGIGAQQGMALDVPGGTLPGVVDGVSFLRAVAQGEITQVPERVTVIGGGDVALDAARSAWRLTEGAVELVYRRSRAEMPAHTAEVAAGLEEGIAAHFQRTPVAIKMGAGVDAGVSEDAGADVAGHAAGGALDVRCAQTRLGKPDVRGRRHLETLHDTETGQPADLVIAAIGQQVERMAGIDYDDDGRIAVGEGNQLLVDDRLFAGGDAVLGPASLIDAVAQGRKAAAAIDRFLGGDGDLDETLQDEAWRDWQTDPHIGREAGFNRRCATSPPQRAVAARRNWEAVEALYPAALASAEALRCLKCNLMQHMDEAQLPPAAWRLLEAGTVHAVCPGPGVYFIFDADKQVLAIKGVADLLAALSELLEPLSGQGPYFFTTEPAHYYSQRESELLQAYSEQHGALPPGIGEDMLDDLF